MEPPQEGSNPIGSINFDWTSTAGVREDMQTTMLVVVKKCVEMFSENKILIMRKQLSH